MEEHRTTLDPNDPRDLVDCFLIESKNLREAGQDASVYEGRQQANHLTIDVKLFSNHVFVFIIRGHGSVDIVRPVHRRFRNNVGGTSLVLFVHDPPS